MNTSNPNTKIQTVKVTHPCIAFKISKTYRETISREELYDVTRHSWRLSDRRNKAIYAFAVFKGVIKEVYQVYAWDEQNTTPNIKYKNKEQPKPNKDKWEFRGEVAPDKIRNLYLGKDISDQLTRREDFDYLNC